MNTIKGAAMVIVLLEDVAEYLRDRIDGGEECRGHDQELSLHIAAVTAAAGMLGAYAEHHQQTERIAKRMQELL